MKLAEGTVSGQETGGDLPSFSLTTSSPSWTAAAAPISSANSPYRQVIMTCCEDISSSFSHDSFRSIRVENGKYFE